MEKADGAGLWTAHISKSTQLRLRLLGRVWEDMREVEVPVQMTSN